MVERIDIKRALEKLAGDESGFKFQSLAVVLAKLRWPELIACERHNDRGLDAHAPASASPDGRGKGLTCSTTGALDKLKSDAEKVQKNYPDVSLLIFYTSEKVTQAAKAAWAQKIREKYGYDLVVASCEEIIASLQLPENVQLCRSHLDIPIPYQPPLADLLRLAHEAAAAVAADWAAHPRLAGKPRIALNAVALSKSGADTTVVVGTAGLRMMLLQGRRIVLEGTAGRGKTTTLVQLAEVGENSHGIPLLIDLPNWVRTGTDILEYVASSPPFRARGIDAEALARLAQAEPCLFLLNGWNEINEPYGSAAVAALRALERSFPTSGIIVATRTHHIVPPLPGAAKFRLPPLTPDQRFGYLEQALGDGPARALNLALSSDPALDELTRTPFVLSEVTALFRSGVPIPRTKLALLRAVVELMESSEEHADQLQAVPIRGRAQYYLCALAMRLTARGEVLLAEPEARSICHSASDSLRDAGQITATPEPADILSVLTSHHILERIDYPSTSFRFEHQQFQEYYAALVLEDELRRMVASGNPAHADVFARTYVNDPSWEEPLRMIAADLGSDGGDIAAAKALVLLALRVDAVFAARLSYLAGPSLWKEIRDEMHARLRALYAASKHPHRDYALAAVLATGSDEFSDILIPLLTNPDQQVRLRAYRSGMPFHPSSLGPDWYRTVAGWAEDHRAEFVGELTTHQGIVEVGLIFARSDPSIAVRSAALNGLSWMGQHETVAEILQSLPDPEFRHVIQKLYREEIHPNLRRRAIVAYRALLDETVDRKARLQITLSLAELGDAGTVVRLKSELDALTPDQVRELSDYTLRPAAKILRATDPQWLSQWVTDRVIQGALCRENWLSLILELPRPLREQLLHRVCTEDLRRKGGGGVTTLLRGFADADIASAVFIGFRDHHRAFVADYRDQEKQAIDEQLRGLLRSIPRAAVVDGLSDLLVQPPEAEDLAIITELFGLRGAETVEANATLPQLQRERLREYLKSAVQFVLSQDDFSGEAKGHLSSALARVGDPDDMADVMEMIRADIERVRQGRAALARGDRSARARGSPMSWSGWHVEALVHLGYRDSEAFLLALLNEPEYEVDAAWAVRAIARNARPGPNAIMGARFGPTGRDFRKVRSGATEWRTVFAEELRVKYAAAIRGRVLDILEESKRCDPKNLPYHHHRLKELAKVLAALDPQDSATLIVEVAALPARFDGWHRTALLEALVFAGITLPTDAVLGIVDPVIAHFRAHGIYGNDGGLLAGILSLLPFVDDPKRGIAYIRETLSDFRLLWYGNRELLMALAQCTDDSGLTFLIDIAGGLNESAFQQIAKEWFEAVAISPLPRARATMLSFVDPDARTSIGDRQLPDEAINFLAGYLSDLARTDPSVAERIIQLTAVPISGQQRTIIAKVIARLNSATALLAGLNLIDDASTTGIPYEIHRAIEDVVLERRPRSERPQGAPLRDGEARSTTYEKRLHAPGPNRRMAP
jgi:hypothetical protein